MIKFESVKISFGKQTILNDVSFEVQKGEIVFVIGRSGVGKSVLLKTLVGLIPVTSGKVIVDDVDVSGFSEAEFLPVRRKCGLVFQYPALLDSLSVYENVSFGIRAHKTLQAEAEIRAKVEEKLRLVHVSPEIQTQRPSTLSFGLQKRVSLARTLAVDPAYLLFDEPTTGLDPVTTHAIHALIHELSKKLRVGCLVVSHDLPHAMKIADRILFLDNAKIVEEGAPEKITRSRVPIVENFFRGIA